MLRSAWIASAVVGALLCPVFAYGSTVWVEDGDAGSVVATAQAPVGAGPLTAIEGALSFGDVDIYEIVLTGGGTFSALAQGESPLFLNPSLFLFDEQGLGVVANDSMFPPDPFFSPGAALLPAGDPLTPAIAGHYFLAISTPHLDPVSASGFIFPCVGCAPHGVFGPTGPGGGSSLAGWSGNPFSAGSYRITLTGAEFAAAVPEPGTIVLLGVGLIAAVRRATPRRRWRGARADAVHANLLSLPPLGAAARQSAPGSPV